MSFGPMQGRPCEATSASYQAQELHIGQASGELPLHSEVMDQLYIEQCTES